jgi:hypothetical protein
MYPQNKKDKAIKKYIANDFNATKTVRELAYPSVLGLLK